jgi:hypothetical protein
MLLEEIAQSLGTAGLRGALTDWHFIGDIAAALFLNWLYRLGRHSRCPMSAAKIKIESIRAWATAHATTKSARGYLGGLAF